MAKKETRLNKTQLSIRKRRDIILGGDVLYIDPATGADSDVGYACSKAGIITEHGHIETENRKAISPVRLHNIMWCLINEFQGYELLVIEGLRKNIGLLHGVGLIKGALGLPTIEIFPRFWRKWAGKDYCAWKLAAQKKKIPTDAEDAKMIGRVTIALAKSFNGRCHPKLSHTGVPNAKEN